MELQDELTIPAPRDEVYKALNDIAVLKACIPGCEELEREGENDLVAKVTLKIGPVKARFGGRVTLDPSKAPDAFSLSGEGDGGVAGFAKGGADVELIEDGEQTILRYNRKGRDWWQAGTAWRAADHQHREEAVEDVLRKIREGDERRG